MAGPAQTSPSAPSDAEGDSGGPPARTPTGRRIAVTGGPGGGKTSVVREYMRRYPATAVQVPEVATLLFSHVFPQVHNAQQRQAVQRAIYHTQLSLESFHLGTCAGGQVLLCDRGTVDGAGYWPEGPAAFFTAMQTEHGRELRRYDAVLFMESAAVGGLPIDHGNVVRREDTGAAADLDQRILAAWSGHPRLLRVPHAQDFAAKLEQGVAALLELIT